MGFAKSARVTTGSRQRAIATRRRSGAWVGICAILLQAIVFAWHHHELVFGSGGRVPALHAQDRSSPLSSTAADEACELCAALHHLSAAPGEFDAGLQPPQAAPAIALKEPARLGLILTLAFRSRAPPRI
jgi:hypothetical protein